MNLFKASLLAAVVLPVAMVPAAFAQTQTADKLSTDCYDRDAKRSIEFSSELSAITGRDGKLAEKEAAAYRYYSEVKALYNGACARTEQAAKRIADADRALTKLPAAASGK